MSSVVRRLFGKKRLWVLLLGAIALTLIINQPLSNSTQAIEPHGNPSAKASPLNTQDIEIPRGPTDYAFVSNYEQVAYLSKDTPSMIHFMPGDSKNPSDLHLLLPDGIVVLGAIRNLDVQKEAADVTIDGTRFTNGWTVKAQQNSSKFTIIWQANAAKNWQDGQALQGYFRGGSKDNFQRYQPLAIKHIEVPTVKPFQSLPVWLSVPSDLIYHWPETANANTDAFKQVGINEMDLWAYVRDRPDQTSDPNARSNRDAFGHEWLTRAAQKLRDSSIQPIPSGSEWWWRSAQSDPAGSAQDSNGQPVSELRLTYNEDDSGQGGKYFREWIRQGKYLIDRGLYVHSVNPEIYRQGELIDYSPSTIEAFKRNCVQNKQEQDCLNPRELAENPGRWPQAEAIWQQFKADRYAQFFVDYRAAMESYMDEKGIDRQQTPFLMKALTTYHRFWPGFTDYADYKRSPAYRKTLEDPPKLAETFDLISPMIYPDIYANGDHYDMKLPQKDTAAISRLIKNSPRNTKVSPILSAGYPFMTGFEADTSADMLKANMLEALAAGSYGFGIWGACPIDAADMKAIAQVVGMLQPYEDILLNGHRAPSVRVQSNKAFARRLLSTGDDGKTRSLVLVSEYSNQTKTLTVEVSGRPSYVAIDLNTGEEISNRPASPFLDEPLKFQTTLSDTEGRAKMFYIGPPP